MSRKYLDLYGFDCVVWLVASRNDGVDGIPSWPGYNGNVITIRSCQRSCHYYQELKTEYRCNSLLVEMHAQRH